MNSPHNTRHIRFSSPAKPVKLPRKHARKLGREGQQPSGDQRGVCEVWLPASVTSKIQTNDKAIDWPE